MYRPQLLILTAVLLAACESKVEVAFDADADEHGFTAPTAHTLDANRAVAESLPLTDPTDFEQANRGLVARDPSLVIPRGDGSNSWSMPDYAFIEGDAPASVNPSLWRQARLNNLHGLYEVTDGVWQIRGYDLANMSIIRGQRGWIIVDPLTIEETARRALAFVNEQLGERPVSAVLFTHSHIDHFGGVAGVLPDDPGAPVEIIAPAGFMEEATSENVMAGVAMQRRASFMYGMRLPRSPRGHIDTGLGKQPAANGLIGIREPTREMGQTGEALTIDGVRFVFQFTPASEAPAEFTFYLPEKKAFCGAEVVSRNLHNVYTLRGAKVRNALLWSDYIDEAARMFADAEIYFGSHHWPIWGRQRVQQFLKTQRDTYKYIHDQTVRLANHGYTPREIAEQLRLPESLRTTFSSRDYYGTVRHDSKAVYQWYFGWYDGNPANLDPLPPGDSGARYVALAGGADALLAKAEAAYEKGEYRWVAELVNHLVFADPGNAAARALLARAYDQLGYQAESGPWRDVYLSAAYELRHGGTDRGASLADAVGLLREIPMPRFFESMAARLNGPKAEGKNLKINMVFSDLDQSYVLDIENAVLHHHRAPPADDADATLTMTHELFLKMAIGQAGLKDTLMSDDLDVAGSRLKLVQFFSLLDKPDGKFNIIEP